MKKLVWIFIILVIFLIFLMFPWMMFGSFREPNPPKPRIRSGEFPFTIVYEINGEKIIIEDTMICKYDGVGWNEGVGKYRKWKSYLASSPKEDAVLLVADDKRKIYCFVGSAEYYMGDEKYPEKRPLTPRLINIRLDNDFTSISQDELLEMYNIRLISWEFSDPIVNSFK